LPQGSNNSTPCLARLFWDAGDIWPVMAWQALTRAGLKVRPINSTQIRSGELRQTRLLMVPGGWSSLKKLALEPKGCQAIREFVHDGGFYLGLCGGAGLSLNVADGLGMVPLGRVSGQARLAAVSGPVMVRPDPNQNNGSWFQGLDSPARFQVWWPGQFAAPQHDHISILASYAGPAPGLCTSDLEADLVAEHDWLALEAQYNCSLDPGRLKGLPAVLGCEYGKGSIFISYLHFDTPGDANGARVLKNLWQKVLGDEGLTAPGQQLEPDKCLSGPIEKSRELWNQGRELGLWQNRRSPSIFPLWKRGSRGLEFFSLTYLIEAAAALAGEECTWAQTELEQLLEPVFIKGPEVLRCQAALLRGEKAACRAHAEWFPRPRRKAGDLARVMLGLETLIQRLI
jgi:hypothetical protein